MMGYSRRNINISVGEAEVQPNTSLTREKNEDVCSEAELADSLLLSLLPVFSAFFFSPQKTYKAYSVVESN